MFKIESFEDEILVKTRFRELWSEAEVWAKLESLTYGKAVVTLNTDSVTFENGKCTADTRRPFHKL